jgi:hypothetical protein
MFDAECRKKVKRRTPELGADLVTALAALNVNDFAHL